MMGMLKKEEKRGTGWIPASAGTTVEKAGTTVGIKKEEKR